MIPIKLIPRNDQLDKTTSEAGLVTQSIKKGKADIRSLLQPLLYSTMWRSFKPSDGYSDEIPRIFDGLR
jgi:hypothetical protein